MKFEHTDDFAGAGIKQRQAKPRLQLLVLHSYKEWLD